MSYNGKADLKILCSETAPGGEYAKVRILGKGHITGDLLCESFENSGAGQVDGNVECQGELECGGKLRIEGALSCADLEINGSAQTGDAVTCTALEVNGSARFSGDMVCVGDAEISGKLELSGALHCKDLECNGVMRVSGSAKCADAEITGKCAVSGDLEADEIQVNGAIQVDGLLNAERICLSANPHSVLGEIGGSEITVKRTPWNSGSLRGEAENLKAKVIEGDTIVLENTTAEVVRGRSVTIGEGCRIDRVEYAEHLDAAQDTVRHSVRTGEE